MAISLGSNIASLQAQRRLSATDEQLSRTYSKLSSGQRIDRASDDAAGLSVADSLKSQRRMASVAIRNANDAISLISIADGGLAEMSNLLVRMSELATQAVSGTYSAAQRGALDGEWQALYSEIDRIAYTTGFNSLKPLQNSSTSFSIQIGIDNSANSQVTFSSIDAKAQSMNIYGRNLLTTTSAQTALQSVAQDLPAVTSYRGTFGAIESRLRYAVSNLAIAAENFSAAEGRIRDVDVAQESAELTRLTILRNAGASVLAQANQGPALAMQLLG